MSRSSGIDVVDEQRIVARVESPQPERETRRLRAEHGAEPAGSESIPFLGEVFAARYRLLERLGRRGGGRVFRARDDILARDVAVKIFHVDPADAAGSPRRLAGARVLAGLDHPSLVTFYDAHLTRKGDGYLVRELIPGPPLRDHLDAAGPQTPEHAAALLHDVARGLAAIHEVGVIHGHVTSSDILLRPLRNAPRPFAGVLTEFSVSHLMGEEVSRDPMDAETESADYLPPELLAGGIPRAETDIYALGLLGLELLTGERPLKGGAVQELVLAPLSYDPEIPTRFGYGWELLLTAMTDPDPTARPTAAEVAVLAAELNDGAVLPGSVASTLAEPPIAQQAAAVAVAAALTEPAAASQDEAEAAAEPVAAQRADDRARATTARYRGRRPIWAWVTHAR